MVYILYPAIAALGNNRCCGFRIQAAEKIKPSRHCLEGLSSLGWHHPCTAHPSLVHCSTQLYHNSEVSRAKTLFPLATSCAYHQLSRKRHRSFNGRSARRGRRRCQHNSSGRFWLQSPAAPQRNTVHRERDTKCIPTCQSRVAVATRPPCTNQQTKIKIR